MLRCEHVSYVLSLLEKLGQEKSFSAPLLLIGTKAVHFTLQHTEQCGDLLGLNGIFAFLLFRIC